VRLFGKSFGNARLLAQARAAELRAELAQAAALFAQAGRPDEAARVMVLRGDAEAEASARMRHYLQAAATAPEGSQARAHALRKRAALVLGMARGAPERPATLAQDLLEAARDLEALGEHDKAAEAYAYAGDMEGQARALARAGDVDRLDALLLAQQSRDREALARREAHEQVAMLVASGRRREAAATARVSSDDLVRERGLGLEAQRLGGDLVRLALRGKEMTLVLGDEVSVGRAGLLSIASAAVSRHHAVVARTQGEPVVRDLGSRNGTILRGLALVGEARVADGIEVRLGKEVPLVVRPATELPGAVAIELAGTRYVAPLGPARLGVGQWRLERASDGWVELATDDDPPPFSGALQLAPRITLIAGDAIARERGGPPVFEVRQGAR
jgi:hypothetical protein